ncbi:MAG: winged helix-turn-helix domain-containing protein [Pseudomonadota bacterium]
MNLHQKILILTRDSLSASVIEQYLASEGWPQLVTMLHGVNQAQDDGDSNDHRNELARNLRHADVVVVDGDVLTPVLERALVDHPVIMIGAPKPPRPTGRSAPERILKKPIKPADLVANLQQILAPIHHTLGPWRFCPGTRSLTHEDGHSCALTEREDHLLALLCRREPLGGEDLRRAVWGRASAVSQTLHTHLARLRRKIAPVRITCTDQSYRLDDDPV